MKKGFMGKKVNIFLLLMLMLVLIGFGGISVYYQYTFKDINQKYNNISTNWEVCKQNLTETADRLMKTIRNLNSTETDIRKYDVLYEQKAEELANTESELEDTQAELSRVTLQKEVYKKQIDQAYKQIFALNSTIKSLDKRINSLNRTINSQKYKIDCLVTTDDDDEVSVCI